MQQKLVPDLFIILFCNLKQPLHARKALKVVTSFFLSNSVPFSRKKQRGPVAIQVTKQVQKNPIISYVLCDEVWWCNIKRFSSYSKNYVCKFMQANLWHYKLFHFHLRFWIWKVWKGRGKITKKWISRERKELFRWNKKHLS